MSRPKKFTQTTLPFLIKPKSADVPGKVATLTTRKRPKAQESKDDIQKKSKPSPLFKPSTSPTDISAAGEPEVSSSSEPVQATTSSSDATQSTLEPFIKLTRCETPKIEVTSSTSTDDGVDTTLETDEMGSPSVCQPVVVERPIVIEEDVVKSCKPLVEDVPTAGVSTSNSGTEADGPCSDLNISPDTPECTDSATPFSQRTAPKFLSSSSKKRSEKVKRELEERRIKKEEEREQKRVQKLDEKLIKEKELEEKKQLKAGQKEAERLVKLKEREEKQRQKEALQVQKQAEIDEKNALKASKEAERHRREEERQKKEQEKKLKEAERLRVEEEKLRKKEAEKNRLLKFFTKPKSDSPAKVDTTPTERTGKFKPFSIKVDMRLAPLCRVAAIDKAQFDEAFRQQALVEHVYLRELKSSGARSSPSTWPWVDDDIIEELSVVSKHRVKLLQFHTDVRPAYFGTWTKKSSYIRPRRPLVQDKQRFDYDVDSADEWEEEEPGESVDSGEEEEEKDEFDFDPELREDGFLVDHNYLSDGEGGVSDEEESLAAKKTKQMIARTYGKRNRKKHKLKPVVYGTVWEGEDDLTLEENHGNTLQQFKAIVFESIPIVFIDPEAKTSPKLSESDTSSSASKRLCQPCPPEAIPDVIRMMHGCMDSSKAIILRFQEFWKNRTSNTLPKRQMKITIQALGSYEKKSLYRKRCWYVNEATLLKYGLTDLPVPHPIHQITTASASATPPNGTPAAKPSVSDTSQKRLTDFVQSAKKRLKVETVGTLPGVAQQRDVELITLSDSPHSTTATPSSGHQKHTRIPLVTLADSPQSASVDTHLSRSTIGTPTVKEVRNASPRRVPLCTVSSTQAQPNAAPRRVGLTTLHSVPVTGPVVKANSPRRVPLTTLSTPPKVNPTKGMSGKAMEGHSPKTNNQVVVARSPQASVSPRRVQLTTLSKPAVTAAKQPNTLTELSQNTPKTEICPSPSKNTTSK